jgi:hypothetical protein
MKNIHSLSTDKPGKLLSIEDRLTIVHSEFFSNQYIKLHGYQSKSMYITSEEEIKEGDYYIHGNRLHKHIGKKCLDILSNKEYPISRMINDSVFKKIILTTDLEIQKDGVQPIDDKFLEWFVKNPTCEEVEVKHKDIIQYGNMTMYNHNGDGSHYFCTNCAAETSRSKEELLKFGVEYYKIIIPKGELELLYEQIIDVVGGEDRFREIAGLKPKQETIEEAAERMSIDIREEDYKDGFIEGAKSDAARKYWYNIFKQNL